MVWTLILIILGGDMPTTQLVGPFQTEESCTIAADLVREDVRNDKRGYAAVATCVRNK